MKFHLSRDMTKPTNWVCAQRRLRSAWASAQSDQSLRSAFNGYLRTQAFFMRTAKTLIRLGGCPGWSESSLSAQWVAKDPSILHTDSEDSDQTGRMPRLICVFAERPLTLSVLSCHGSFVICSSFSRQSIISAYSTISDKLFCVGIHSFAL